MIFILFKELAPEDLSVVKPYFELMPKGHRPCDFSVGCLFMWRGFYEAAYAISHGSLILRFRGDEGGVCYTYPIGGDTDAAFDELLRAFPDEICICLLTEDEAKMLNDRFNGCEPSCNRDWCDYIYNADDMVSFAGRRFSGQRNHINKFKKLYGEPVFEDITEKNLDAVKAWFVSFYEKNPPQNEDLIFERSAILELLDNYSYYEQPGLILTVDGKIVAVSIGECVGDTLIVHTEKADREFEGAYPVIVQGFAKRYCDENIRFINREEDCGESGLRTSKLSYHPCVLLDKWDVTIKK